MEFEHELLLEVPSARPLRIAAVHYFLEALLQILQILAEFLAELPLLGVSDALLDFLPGDFCDCGLAGVVAVQEGVDVALDPDFEGVVVLPADFSGVPDLADEGVGLRGLPVLLEVDDDLAGGEGEADAAAVLLLDFLDVLALADLHHFLVDGPAELVEVQAVVVVGVDELLRQQVLVLVRRQQTLAAQDEVAGPRFLHEDDLAADGLLFPAVGEARQADGVQEVFGGEVAALGGEGGVGLGRGEGSAGDFGVFAGSFGGDLLFGAGAELFGRGGGVGQVPVLVVDEDVETGDPEIAGGFIVGAQLVDAFLGDELEGGVAEGFDVADVVDGDLLPRFLEGLVGEVGEAILDDDEISFLPN